MTTDLSARARAAIEEALRSEAAVQAALAAGRLGADLRQPDLIESVDDVAGDFLRLLVRASCRDEPWPPRAAGELDALLTMLSRSLSFPELMSVCLAANRSCQHFLGDVLDAQQDAMSPAMTRSLWKAQSEASTLAITVAATVHRRLEDEQADLTQRRLRMSLAALLAGDLTDVENRVTLRRLGMLPDADHWVWCVRAPADVEHLVRRLFGQDAAPPTAVMTVWDGLVVGLSSRPPPHDISYVDGGVDGPSHVTDLPEAFDRANRARLTVDAFGLNGTYQLDDLGLLGEVLANPNVGKTLVRRFVDPLVTTGTPVDELLATVRSFLHHQRKREDVATDLHLHPNTVTYRINRFRKMTGADLEDHRTQAELWWLFRYLEVSS